MYISWELFSKVIEIFWVNPDSITRVRIHNLLISLHLNTTGTVLAVNSGILPICCESKSFVCDNPVLSSIKTVSQLSQTFEFDLHIDLCMMYFCMCLHCFLLPRIGHHVHVPNPHTKRLEWSDAPVYVANGRVSGHACLCGHLLHILPSLCHAGKYGHSYNANNNLDLYIT